MKPPKPPTTPVTTARIHPHRVLMTADCIGGVWTYALELVSALRKWDIDVCLAVMGRPLTKAQSRQAAALPNLEVCEGNYKLEWMDQPWPDVQASGEWLWELEDEFCPDIIHLNGYAHGVVPFSAPKLVVGHSCVCSWWEAVKAERAPADWDTYRDHVRNGLQDADLVIAPSRTMLEALQTTYGPFPATRVIPNGRSAPSRVRSGKAHTILGAGRLWDEAKNITALTRIAHRLPWPVYIAGETNDKTSFETANVRWLGKLSASDLWLWHQRSSIFVSPARYEPFGLCLLEAALCGTALIAGDIPSLREVWGDAAIYVAPDDSEALAGTLAELTANPRLVSDWGRRARDRALNYSPARMAAAYVESYSGLLASSSAPVELTPA